MRIGVDEKSWEKDQVKLPEVKQFDAEEDILCGV